MRHRLTGILAPRQVRSRRARLLARVPLPPFVPLRLSRRRGPAGLVIQRRRQRRISLLTEQRSVFSQLNGLMAVSGYTVTGHDWRAGTGPRGTGGAPGGQAGE